MDNFKPVLRFVAMSDVHVKDDPACIELERLEKAMKCAYDYSDSQEYDRLDAIYVVGDFANSGTEQQMKNFCDVFYKYLRVNTKAVVSTASHEYGAGEEVAKQRLKDIVGMKDIHDHSVINGFHFISLSSTRGCRYDEAEQEYARQALKEAAADDKKKPIFFFQHPHVSGTVYGSINWGEDDLYAIMMDYPQIINFSGHSHAPINDPRSVHQQYITCHGTGSMSYFELDEFDKYYGTVPPDARQCAQMLIVEADENGAVLIKPFDVLTGKFFPCERFIKTPWDPESFTYTVKRGVNAPAPYFENGDVVKTETEDGKVKITFAQAKQDVDGVNYYIIRIKDSDGVTVRQKALWSGYYLYDMPETLSIEIEELLPGDYTAKLIPVGFWDNEGEPVEFGFTV